VATLGLMPLVPESKDTNKAEQRLSLSELPKGKNKVGFNLLLWTASISEKMNPVAERLKNIGYDGVEVAMGELQTQPYIDFGKHAKGLGLEVNSVLAVGKEEDPINETAAIREKALDKLKWAVDRSNDMGSHLICGPFHSAFAFFRHRPPSEDEYKWSAEVLHKAGEYAAKSDTIFTVEALNRFECYLCNTVAQLEKLVTLADHPNIRPMFDSHHANMEEKKNGPAIEKLKGKLAHVHISENDRGTPGDGHIHWDDIFASLAKINYTGWLTIESFSRSDQAFANSINVWRQFSEPWDVVAKGLTLIRSMQAKYKL
jgi:D-psicose/D-tagatose/L-ribulose 3-epimerase